jgi:tRNA1(Val) A37 N6-methylase TrmN6
LVLVKTSGFLSLQGGLPEKRIEKKCQQLENYLFTIRQLIANKTLYSKNLRIVDFCSGGGHLGLLIAYFFRSFQVSLIDNKEESLELAIKRMNQLKLKNISVYKVNFIFI